MRPLVSLVAIVCFLCCEADANAQIGKFFKNLDPTNKNSAIRKGVKNLDPTNKNSAIRKGAKNLDPTNKNSAIRKGAKNLDITNKNSAIRKGAKELDITDRNSGIRDTLRKIDPVEALKKEAYFAYRSKYMKYTKGKSWVTLQPSGFHYKQLKRAQDQGILPKVDLNGVRWMFLTPVPPEMAAITFGDKVLVKQVFDRSDPNLTILMAHELIHVQQNRRVGGEATFAQRYINSSLREWKKNFSMSAAYENNGLELEAQKYERAFYNWIVAELAKQRRAEQQAKTAPKKNQVLTIPTIPKTSPQTKPNSTQPGMKLPNQKLPTLPNQKLPTLPNQKLPTLPAQSKNYFGMNVSMVSRPNLGLTMQVQSVTAGGPAANAGLEFGDEIVFVNGQRFSSGDPGAAIEQLQQFTRSAQAKTHTLIVRNVKNGQLVQVPIRPTKK